MQDKLAAIKNDIVEITQQYWDKTGRALLLASLGKSLVERGYDLRVDLGRRKLEPFIQIELNDVVTTLVSPFDPLVRGVVPAGAEKGKDLKTLFAKPADSGERVTWDKRIWVAFSRPLPADHTRLIFFEPEIGFEDVPVGTPTPSGKYVVPGALIIPAGTMAISVRNAELHRNILKWLEENKLNIENAKVVRSMTTMGYRDGSILGALIDALDRRDLERIAIPLDIVAKLLSRRLKRGS